MMVHTGSGLMKKQAERQILNSSERVVCNGEETQCSYFMMGEKDLKKIGEEKRFQTYGSRKY